MFYQDLFRRFKNICKYCISLIAIAIISPSVLAELAESPNSQHLTRLQWQQDLDVLNADIYQYHVNPFWFKNEVGYKKLYKETSDYIATEKSISANKINGYFEKLVAYISDGHSYVVNKAARFGVFSYSLEWFGDDLHIIEVEQGDNDFLGARVLAFDGMSVEKANKRIAAYIPIVNSSGFKFHSKDAYHFAGLLQDAGVSKKSQNIELTLELISGKRVKKIFNLRRQEIESVELHEPPTLPEPLYRQQQDKKQCFFWKRSRPFIFDMHR